MRITPNFAETAVKFAAGGRERIVRIRQALVTRVAATCAAAVVMTGMSVSATDAFAYEACETPQFGAAAVAVDERAETAEQAQTNGMRRATDLAFRRVLMRLLRSEEATTAFIEANSPDRFVDFFHIASENTIAGRYIATLDYCFSAATLRDAFRDAGLLWAELRSPRILVLPVWLAPDGARAWQPDNAWLAGWRDTVSEADGLVDFTLLEPTILNERSLRAADLAIADQRVLRRAATVAGADQIMLVTARLDYRGSQLILAVDGQLFTATAEQLTVLGKMVDTPVNDNLEMQLDLARKSILTELESGWHAANTIRGGQTQEITVVVPVASLSQWVERLEAFDSLAVIDSYLIRSLNVRGGVVTLRLVGDAAAFENGLSARRLRLRQREDGTNVIESR
jgi:hypothetical protein